VTAPSIPITARVARRLLREVVAEVGRDRVISDTCTYADLTSSRPRCLVGHALHRAGVDVDELSWMDCHTPTFIDVVRVPARVRLTWPARMVFRRAQVAQDRGRPWGVAVDEALLVRPFQRVA
jgi:hypothetical protein